MPRHPGLAAAIQVAGGVGRLAEMLGLSQPTISIWKRIPPHRVIEVERLTGISRRVLRPDLFDVPELGMPKLGMPEMGTPEPGNAADGACTGADVSGNAPGHR